MHIRVRQLHTKGDTETVQGGFRGGIIRHRRTGNDSKARGNGNYEAVLATRLRGIKCGSDI
jgi:hypothetical protein